MSTFIPFVPNVQSPFTFQATFDGQVYAGSVTWNLFSQRWYVNVTQLTGELVFSLPLIGSPDGAPVADISWSFGTVTLVTERPHGFTPGQTVAVTVTDNAPDAYNGNVLALVVDPVTLSYPVAADPGPATQLGQATYNVNLLAGYFTDSAMVFRESSQTFIVAP